MQDVYFFTRPVAAKDKKIFEPLDMDFIFSKNELVLYFDNVIKVLSSLNHPWMIYLMNYNHTISVQWKHGSWRLIDPNYMFEKQYLAMSSSDLALAIFKSFRSEHHVACSFHVVSNYQDPSLKENLGKLKIANEIDLYDDLGVGLLHLACRRSDATLVDRLVDAGADVNKMTKDKNTPLSLTIKHQDNSVNISRTLLEKGADLNQLIEDEDTALSLALQLQDTDLTKLLISYKANVNDTLPDGYTTFQIAYESADIDCMQLLIEHGVDPNVKGNDGNTALMFAFKTRNLSMIRFLLTQDININQSDSSGFFPLFWACKEDDEALVKELLQDKRLDLDQVDDIKGYPALLLAAELGHKKITSMLLKAGARIDKVLSNNETLLSNALSLCDDNILQVLLNHAITHNVFYESVENPLSLQILSLTEKSEFSFLKNYLFSDKRELSAFMN